MIGHVEEFESNVVEDGADHGSAADLCGLEDRTREVGSVEIGVREVGAAEVGLREIETAEIHARQIGIDEIRGEVRVGLSPLVPLAGFKLCYVIWIGHQPLLPSLLSFGAPLSL